MQVNEGDLPREQSNNMGGHAYCPTRSSSTCASYSHCEVKSDDLKEVIEQQFLSQCDKFKSPSVGAGMEQLEGMLANVMPRAPQTSWR